MKINIENLITKNYDEILKEMGNVVEKLDVTFLEELKHFEHGIKFYFILF